MNSERCWNLDMSVQMDVAGIERECDREWWFCVHQEWVFGIMATHFFKFGCHSFDAASTHFVSFVPIFAWVQV